jgi:AmmeMemoRadiSam system protein A
MAEQLTNEERTLLLELARQALEDGVHGRLLEKLSLEELSPILREPGASFVTLTKKGELRGCVGTLEAYQPLAEDVREHAVAAALQDYRFSPVAPEEVAVLKIEISRLTPPRLLEYEEPDELLARLRPGIDGVILREGIRRATFLPQVWHKIPDPNRFLGHLCQKMGVDENYWRNNSVNIYTYQVEEFHE